MPNLQGQASSLSPYSSRILTETGKMPVLHSPRQPAAINGYGVAVEILGSSRGQKNHCALEVLRATPTARRDASEDFCVPLGVSAQGGSVVRFHVARGDGVDVYAMRRKFVRQDACQAHDRAFGSGV